MRSFQTMTILFWWCLELFQNVVAFQSIHDSRQQHRISSNIQNRHHHHFRATTLLMAIPTLDKWKVMPNGSIIGTVKNHPVIADGDVITTSPITNPNAANPKGIVSTASGSKYKLLQPRGGLKSTVGGGGRPAAFQQQQQSKPPPRQQREKPKPQRQQQEEKQQSSSGSGTSFFPWGGLGGGGGDSSEGTVNGSISVASSSSSSSTDVEDDPEALKKKIRNSSEWSEAVRKYKLTGQTIGLEDEYLLAGRPERSTSGKSNIWEAYKTNDLGLPQENTTPVCLKISNNLEAISREYENYRKLSFLGIARTGKFVRCYEFFPVAGYDQRFRKSCALVIERGEQDLKAFVNSKGNLEGKQLRDACITATQCIQALHNAGLVWTDMKTENFVIMSNGEVKGIDLESAMPINDNPVDYSPEACPPEFATAFLNGEGPYFQLETSYDIWSLGMLMLELATGRGYFDGKNPAQITNILRDLDDSGLDLDDIDCDDGLKDLIRRCLQKDPRKRPNTAQILLHPYFLVGNPFSFL